LQDFDCKAFHLVEQVIDIFGDEIHQACVESFLAETARAFSIVSSASAIAPSPRCLASVRTFALSISLTLASIVSSRSCLLIQPGWLPRWLSPAPWRQHAQPT